MEPPAHPRARFLEITAIVLNRSGARAAGLWMTEAEHLVQLAFVGDDVLDPGVARDFAESTREIRLDPTSKLGIIGAATSGKPTISRASELSPVQGSGRWLRSFGASRSIAVPLGVEPDPRGLPRCRGVLAVALPQLNDSSDELVVEQLLSHEAEFLRELRSGEDPGGANVSLREGHRGEPKPFPC